MTPSSRSVTTSFGLGGLRSTLGPYGPAIGTVAACLLVPLLFPDHFVGMPIGQWVFGIIIGLLAALVAAGMSLVYRANRIINFAQADLGTLPSTIVFSLMAFVGGIFSGRIGYLVGAVLGLILAAGLGAIIERIIIRRFFSAPRLLLTVATIGLSQLLIFASLIIPPLVFGRETLIGQRLAAPFDVSFSVGTTLFGTHELLASLIAPLCLAGIAFLLTRTDVGIAVRAAADRSDRARLLGIPVRNLHTVVWMLAAALSFLGAYLRAGMLGVPFGLELSFGLLLLALGALVLGRMENLTAVAAAAVALGILEQAVTWSFTNNPEYASVAVALAIAVSLMFQRSGSSRRETELSSSWSSADEVRGIPSELAKLPIVRGGGMMLAAIGLLVVFSLPRFLSSTQIFEASAVVAYSLVALSVVVLTGWTGQVSLGQMAFAAVGGAVGAVATATWDLPLAVALVIAGCAGSAVAVIVGIPALRLRGLILAIITLAFSLAASDYLLNRSAQSWIPRERLNRGSFFGLAELDSNESMYYFSLVVAVFMFFAVAGIRRSPVGRHLVGLRDNEKAAAAFATNVVAAKLTAFAISGFIAAVGGCLYVHINRTYSEGPFTAAESLTIFTAAVVGGVTSMAGAVLGAVYLLGGQWFLEGAWRLLPTAFGVLVVLTIFPGGLGSLAYQARDAVLRRIARSNGIVVPSLLGELPEDSPVADPSTDLDHDSADNPVALLTQGSVDHWSGEIDDQRTAANGSSNGSGRGAAALRAASEKALVGTQRLYAGSSEQLDADRPQGLDADRPQRLYVDSMLSVRGVDASYGDVRVLFGVDLDVRQGEIISLLGTNGAGKSTLIRSLTGLLPTDNGEIIFDGEDITHATPERIANLGIAQLPGGEATFGSLTVEENLRVALWQRRGELAATRKVDVEEVLRLFPVLGERFDQAAVDLSGGQQQMLALAMVFLTKPRLLIIDELSLGLAPIIVEQLMGIVENLRDQGTTVLLVEQSVNVALTMADRAYFMEKGEIRYHGEADVLLDNPDLVRSVFFEGAADGLAGAAADNAAAAESVIDRAVAASLVGESKAIEVQAPPLSVQGVSVDFGGLRAVDNVSFDVAPGEVVGLIGPNGAGKTTLFDVISGFTPTVTGAVMMGAYDMSPFSPHRRAISGIGRSFQDARLFGALTVEETIQVALQRWLKVRDPLSAAIRLPNHAYSEALSKHRASELIELLNLGNFRDRFVSELSTGSRRVVDLACILAFEPTVVLLDEPSSGIAQREAEALVPLLERIKTTLGASVLVIEHDMALITELADRLVALESGRVIASGTSQEVLNDAAVVSSYLGSDSVHRQRSGELV